MSEGNSEIKKLLLIGKNERINTILTGVLENKGITVKVCNNIEDSYAPISNGYNSALIHLPSLNENSDEIDYLKEIRENLYSISGKKTITIGALTSQEDFLYSNSSRKGITKRFDQPFENTYVFGSNPLNKSDLEVFTQYIN